MRRYLLLALVALAWTGMARAQGMLVPTDGTVSNLALVNHEVNVTIEDQVAVTKVVQTFRNSTSRPLEADYYFPVPAGASVKKFTMWVDGKEVPGELVEADKARQIYTDIVRKTQDPGLLEYLGNNLLRVRVFPVPANGEQKLSVCFTSIAESTGGTVEYVYPMKCGKAAAQAMRHFLVNVNIKSQQPIHNLYSPSHRVAIEQWTDGRASAHFEWQKTSYVQKFKPMSFMTDKDRADMFSPPEEFVGHDFQLYYTTDAKDVGMTTLFQRPEHDDDGYFLMMLSPRAELAKTQTVPRDVVFVLDTSGSMQGKRIAQAKKALVHCLRGLQPQDRFAMIHFASTVHNYRDKMQTATANNLAQAERWVNDLEATGGTAINDALAQALAMRPGDAGRNFTIVFFTDGQPTVGETNVDQIVKNVEARNTASTRIFTFGVGDDVNTVLLDQLAERTRAVCTYVRENEDIEEKVSKLYQKISKPVLTDLKLKVDDKVTLSEIYPPHLPDLFHGNQLVILGRYHGKGTAKVRLTGMVGKEEREFVYEIHFPKQTKNGKEFVEELWARRKVGYLLGEIRVHGNNQELVDEVVSLAKKYGITTPYTSYLVAPDGATPVANAPVNRTTAPAIYNGTAGNVGGPAVDWPSTRWSPPNSASPAAPSAGPGQPWYPINDLRSQGVVRGFTDFEGSISGKPGTFVGENDPAPGAPAPEPTRAEIPFNGSVIIEEEEERATTANTPKASHPVAPKACVPCSSTPPHSGSQAVDYAVAAQDLRRQDQVGVTNIRRVAGHTFRQAGAYWVDDRFKTDLKTVTIKAQGQAYFDILQKHAEVREVFLLGNHVKWVTPSGTVLVIAADAGRDELGAAEIEALFADRR